MIGPLTFPFQGIEQTYPIFSLLKISFKYGTVKYLSTNMNTNVSSQEAIQGLVQAAVKAYATGFQARHKGERDNPDGTINMKIHNVFIAALGPEIQYYTALVRSLDSSLGNMLEGLAMDIAGLFYEVKRSVEGPLTVEQTQKIAELLEQYRRHEKTPAANDYRFLRSKPTEQVLAHIRHDSDYYLVDKHTANDLFD